MQHRSYFDFNATTPLLPQAREALVEAMDRLWQNPSSLYHEAGAVRRSLEEAREHLAGLLGLGEANRLVFTSGATESNNVLLRHFAATAPGDAVIVTSRVEHPCLREPAAALCPGRVLEAPLELDGTLDLIRKRRPALVSIMSANNETGLLQPWREVRSLCQELGIPFHTDAAQWIGKMPLGEMGGCDWITASAHKFGGPKGSGFLVIPQELDRLHGSFLGGSQEHGRRAGTENTPGVLAMVAAAAEAEALRPSCSEAGRDAFESRLRELVPGTRLVGAGSPRLWNTSLVIVPEHRNLKWQTLLSHRGFQLATGSACGSGKNHPSHVMEAMGLQADETGRVLRASAAWQTTVADWLRLADAFQQVWQELQSPSAEARRGRKVQL